MLWAFSVASYVTVQNTSLVSLTSRQTVQRLLSRLSSPHRGEHSKAAMAVMSFPHLLEQTYGSSGLTGMWTALRLAEAAKYPG